MGFPLFANICWFSLVCLAFWLFGAAGLAWGRGSHQWQWPAEAKKCEIMEDQNEKCHTNTNRHLVLCQAQDLPVYSLPLVSVEQLQEMVVWAGPYPPALHKAHRGLLLIFFIRSVWGRPGAPQRTSAYIPYRKCMKSVGKWNRSSTEEFSLYSLSEVCEISEEIDQELHRGILLIFFIESVLYQ